MGINRVVKRGRLRIEVRRKWPDGAVFRRFYPNMTIARHVQARIESAIALGEWRQLRSRLRGEDHEAHTLRSFSEIFLRDHCRVRMRSWKRYLLSLNNINALLGDVPLTEFHRKDLHRYVRSRRLEVKPNTVNRDIACLKKMFSFALETGAVESHPLVRFPLLPVQETAFRVMTVEQFRSLVDAMDRPSIAAMTAVMGETGLRKGEALGLRWDHIRPEDRTLTVERTKSRRIREVPLSDFAVHWLDRCTRILDCPGVFVNSRTGSAWVNPEKPFRRGRARAGLEWVGFHDLRRFRATTWARAGIDLRTVKRLLGHADIQTTMRYARFVPSALDDVRRAQIAEAVQLETSGRQMGDSREAEKLQRP